MSGAAAPGPGALIGGRYTLVRRLGAGGFGAVWLATDAHARGIDRPVAVKLLHPELHALRGRDFARFRREAEILGQLDHPSIARAIAYDLEGEHAYIVMEHVDGLPLDKVLVSAAKRGGAVAPADAARIFDEMCSAVAYAHDLGIVHRDLKPKNVMVVRRAERVFVKVLDFGIARVAGEAGDGGTTIGRVIGSYFYMAPEQVRGERPDARADVFALGAMLFELVTGHRAWALARDGQPLPAHEPVGKAPPNTLADITTRLLTGPRPVPSDVVEGLPLGLDAVVARALAIEPSDRFISVTALAGAARPHLVERKSQTGMTIVALEAEVRAALLGEAGGRSSEEGERVEPKGAPGVERNAAPSSAIAAPVPRAPALEPPGAAITQALPPTSDGAPSSSGEATPMAWISGSLGAPPPGPPPRAMRSALIALGVVSFACASVVFALATMRRAPLPEAPEAAVVEAAPRAAPIGVVTSSRAGVALAAPAPATPSASPSASPIAGASPTSTPARPAPRSAAPVSDGGASVRATPAAPEPASARLTRLLTTARAQPSDLAALTTLADAIRSEANRRPAGPIRTRVLREVESSLAYGDLDGLADALRLLEEQGAP